MIRRSHRTGSHRIAISVNGSRVALRVSSLDPCFSFATDKSDRIFGDI